MSCDALMPPRQDLQTQRPHAITMWIIAASCANGIGARLTVSTRPLQASFSLHNHPAANQAQTRRAPRDQIKAGHGRRELQRCLHRPRGRRARPRSGAPRSSAWPPSSPSRPPPDRPRQESSTSTSRRARRTRYAPFEDIYYASSFH
jgi:hypothetical protein